MTEETGGQVIAWDVNRQAIAEVAEDLKDIDAYEDLPAAKAAKKTLTKMRTALGEAHKETKAEALAFGRKVDAKKNEYLALIKEIEDPITADLDKIKNAEAMAEEERVSEIMAHIERLQAFALDRHSLTLEEMEERRANLALEHIDPEIYQELEEDAKLSKDEADLKLRLAIDRESTRLDEEREKKRIERENQELRDKLAKSEEEEAERNRIAREEQAAKDAEARAAQKVIDDEKQAALDAEKAELEVARKELEADQQRIADERQAEADHQAQLNADAEAAALLAMQAPDVVKLTQYAEAVDHLIGLKPVMGSTAGSTAILTATAVMIEVAYDLNQAAEEMK